MNYCVTQKVLTGEISGDFKRIGNQTPRYPAWCHYFRYNPLQIRHLPLWRIHLKSFVVSRPVYGFFGGCLGFFSWTKQNLVGIDPGFKLAREEPGFLWSIKLWSDLRLHILECSFTGVFVHPLLSRAIWIATLCFAVLSDARTFWLPCLKNLYSRR